MNSSSTSPPTFSSESSSLTPARKQQHELAAVNELNQICCQVCDDKAKAGKTCQGTHEHQPLVTLVWHSSQPPCYSMLFRSGHVSPNSNNRTSDPEASEMHIGPDTSRPCNLELPAPNPNSKHVFPPCATGVLG